MASSSRRRRDPSGRSSDRHTAVGRGSAVSSVGPGPRRRAASPPSSKAASTSSSDPGVNNRTLSVS